MPICHEHQCDAVECGCDEDIPRCTEYVPSILDGDGNVVHAGFVCNTPLIPCGPNLDCPYELDHVMEHKARLAEISGDASCECAREEGFPCMHDIELDMSKVSAETRIRATT